MWCTVVAGGFVQGNHNFAARFRCQVIPRVFSSWADLVKLFSQPTHPPCFHGEYVVSIICFHCFFGVKVPGGCH